MRCSGSCRVEKKQSGTEQLYRWNYCVEYCIFRRKYRRKGRNSGQVSGTGKICYILFLSVTERERKISVTPWSPMIFNGYTKVGFLIMRFSRREGGEIGSFIMVLPHWKFYFRSMCQRPFSDHSETFRKEHFSVSLRLGVFWPQYYMSIVSSKCFCGSLYSIKFL